MRHCFISTRLGRFQEGSELNGKLYVYSHRGIPPASLPRNAACQSHRPSSAVCLWSRTSGRYTEVRVVASVGQLWPAMTEGEGRAAVGRGGAGRETPRASTPSPPPLPPHAHGGRQSPSTDQLTTGCGGGGGGAQNTMGTADARSSEVHSHPPQPSIPQSTAVHSRSQPFTAVHSRPQPSAASAASAASTGFQSRPQPSTAIGRVVQSRSKPSAAPAVGRRMSTCERGVGWAVARGDEGVRTAAVAPDSGGWFDEGGQN